MKSFFRLSFLAAIFVIAMVSCKGDKETTVISVSDVSISIQGLTGNTLTLTVDNEVTVTITVSPPDATNKGVTLESGDKTVLSVTETASLTWTIKALNAGSTTLTATAKDGSGKDMTINVTVNAVVSPDATLVSIAVSGNPVKKEYQLNEPFNPEGITVTATYSDNSTNPVPFADLVFDAEFSKTAGTNKTVKVSFSYKGVTKTADITGITVSGTAVGYKIGDTGPGGGKIFYINLAGFEVSTTSSATSSLKSTTICHYLEVAPDEKSEDTWASKANFPPGAGDGSGTGNWLKITGTKEGIGTGRMNTELILAKDPNAPPAKYCKNYAGGGLTDWYLPSIDELEQVFPLKDIIGANAIQYWSSTESDYVDPYYPAPLGSQALNVMFNSGWGASLDGDRGIAWKSNTHGTRPIRAF